MDDDTTLGEVKRWLAEHSEEGVRCPCCARYVKVYRRTLPSATAATMIRMYRINQGRDYIYLPPILDTMKGTPHQGGYGTFGHHWGLLEAMPGERDDGSNRVGWWRLTDLGRSFVHGMTVPKFALIYNNRCLTVYGPAWSIQDALGTPFDYNEMMQGDSE